MSRSRRRARDPDAIVVGGGHNALVAAALLARGGLRPLVLERRDVLGGAAATEEIFPGCRVGVAAQDAGLFSARLAAQLDLRAHGLRWIRPPALATALDDDGRPLTVSRRAEDARREIARRSRRDADRFPEWATRLDVLAAALRTALAHPTPDLGDSSQAGRLALLKPLARAARLGRKTLVELLRVASLPAGDLVDEWFEDEAVKGLVATGSLPGSVHGPSAMGGAMRMLYHAGGGDACGVRSSRFAQGGIGALNDALASAARASGAAVRTSATVTRILVRDGAVRGVVLEGGEEIPARLVASGADPLRTFHDLVGAPALGPRFNRRVGGVRLRGSVAVLHLLLDGPPPAPTPATLGGHTWVNARLERMERVADDAKYGVPSARPVLDMTIPTLHDESLAPAGRHVASIQIRSAPHRADAGLEHGPDGASGGSSVADRLAESALTALEERLPGLSDRILERRLATPLDLERDLALTGGDGYHGQMDLDQLLCMRPFARWANHRTPIAGLYLCGSGTHPGGGVTGLPGRLAAQRILRDERARRRRGRRR